MLALIALALVLVLMLAAPPLVVMFQDARGDGELFPMVRIIQKNDGYFKKIMATEVGSEAVSSEFTGHQGVFSSYGNFVNMLFPDVFESVPFFANDLLSEIPQYIGVIPLLVSVIGMLYSRSRYRLVALIMMAVLALNMFSFDGMSGKPFNLVQQAFNTVFPPLRMIEVREAFGSFYLLFHGVLVCLGLNILLDREAFTALVREKRMQLFVIIGLAVLAKVAITAYYAEKAVVASPIDLLVLIQMALFAAALQAARSERVPRELLLGGLLLLVLADLTVYSRYNAKYILADSADAYEIADFSRTNEGRRSFAYFKEPWVATPGFAYGESITRIKGVLSPGNNHTIFSTKRYYDLVTHVPVANHLALSGVLQPVVRFVPAERAVPVSNGPAFLEFAATAQEADLAERIFIERPDTGAGRALRSVGQLKSYPNVPELHPANLYPALQRYQNDRQQSLQARQANAAASFATDEHLLAVVGDTANSVAVQVRNRRAGYLYLNDGWSKYWRAFDGGRELPLYIANYNSKAVFLEPGEHVVRFSFEPAPYTAALLLFASGLVIVTGLLAALWWKLRNQGLSEDPAAATGACRAAGEER
jgi:hypothetical protein